MRLANTLMASTLFLVLAASAPAKRDDQLDNIGIDLSGGITLREGQDDADVVATESDPKNKRDEQLDNIGIDLGGGISLREGQDNAEDDAGITAKSKRGGKGGGALENLLDLDVNLREGNSKRDEQGEQGKKGDKGDKGEKGNILGDLLDLVGL